MKNKGLVNSAINISGNLPNNMRDQIIIKCIYKKSANEWFVDLHIGAFDA